MYSMYVEYLIWVCVRSEVSWCVLWYLGSGSWARPSGSLRSRRSEACNYWSLPDPLWGRYGSSDACCSCTDAEENFKKQKEREHVRSSTCVGMHLSACACQTDCRTIFSVNSLGQAVPLEIEREAKVYVCVRPSHTVQRHTGLWRPPVLFQLQHGTNMAEKHQLWPAIQLSFRWPQSIKLKPYFITSFERYRASLSYGM